MKHIKMPKALAEKWLKDLRSGEYRQCRSRMRDETGFCCLGVLQMSISGEIIKDPDAELPNEDWLRSKNIEFFNGWEKTDGNPYCTDKEQPFSVLNDIGIPFPEIADLLEDEIEYNDE